MSFDVETRPMKAPIENNATDTTQLLKRLGRRSIVFVGIMGAGKTVIGRKIASIFGLPFVDSDHEIEKVSRMTIPELFVAYGEPEFRALEQRVIERLLRNGPQVLSTGGGAYMSEATRLVVKKRGISIWLKADLDTLMHRVSKRQNRPLLNTEDPRAMMQRLMDVRYPVYGTADITIQSRDEPKEIITHEVLSGLDVHFTRELRNKKPTR